MKRRQPSRTKPATSSKRARPAPAKKYDYSNDQSNQDNDVNSSEESDHDNESAVDSDDDYVPSGRSKNSIVISSESSQELQVHPFFTSTKLKLSAAASAARPSRARASQAKNARVAPSKVAKPRSAPSRSKARVTRHRDDVSDNEEASDADELMEPPPRTRLAPSFGFETLPSVILSEICMFLTLDETIGKMSALSSWVSDTLSVCQTQKLCNWLTINLPQINYMSVPGLDVDAFKHSILAANTGRLKHVKTASSLAINCPLGPLGRPVVKGSMIGTIISEAAKSLSSNRLIDLFVHQRYSGTTAPYLINIILSRALKRQGGSPSEDRSPSSGSLSLKRLYVDLDSGLEQLYRGHRMGFTDCRTDWSCLKSLQFLEHVTLVLPVVYGGTTLNLALRSFVEFLPPSVKELNISNISSGSADVKAMWTQLFADDEYLPLLERFGANMNIVLPHPINTTVMKSTGTVRRLRSIRAQVSDITELQPLQELHDLSLEPMTDVVADQLLACPDDQFPLLRTLRLSGESSSKVFNTVFPFIVFASKRPVEELSIEPNPGSINFNLSPEAIRAIGECSMLRSLIIKVGSYTRVIAASVKGSLPADSLPHLQVLELSWHSISAAEVQTFLAATPNCRQAKIGHYSSSGITLSQLVAPALHFCSFISRLEVSCGSSYENPVSVTDQFKLFPVHSAGLPNLLKISITSAPGKLNEAGLHCLISKLKAAPRLVLFLAPFINKITALCCLRQLPHIITLAHFNQQTNVHRKDIKLNIPVLQDCLTSLRTVGFTSPFERQLTRPSNQPSSMKGDTVNDILSELFGSDCSYKAFNMALDTSGKDSRQRYFETLRFNLSQEDKDNVTAWDKGKYKVKPANVSHNRVTAADPSRSFPVLQYY